MTAASDRAYRELQRLARASGRGTQELLELYVHERFLARLARSPHRERFVLKGGLLLTVHDVRRPTRDIDLLARGLSNEPDPMARVVAEVASIDIREDGVDFDVSMIAAQPIREETEYRGLRITLPASLSTARLRVQVDISTGDPISPEKVEYTELLGGTFSVLGYSVPQTLGEKIATMVARGDTNTRDRDWADVYLLSSRHQVAARELGSALEATATYSNHGLRPLVEVLDALPSSRQAPWAAFRDRAGLEGTTPEEFAEVVDSVTRFADPVLAGRRNGSWDPQTQEWRG